ncbi:fungal-specific transcription factor domain-containing protein [Trametes punicea]|nr:fungal-specific transcription factor domain-containing protein [Trametes punicea]
MSTDPTSSQHPPKSQAEQLENAQVEATSLGESSRTAATLTKSGAVSKMRSHRGNIPTLPQNKLCPLCPAKFTRTTHLNRHLKTRELCMLVVRKRSLSRVVDTNERLHECDRCHAQFTRSDLLTRHRRTCCDSSLTNRSRRKSCQNCADSKVKCDLQRPCSRCKTRNRDCVYVNFTSTVSEEGSQTQNEGSSSSGSSPRALLDSPSDMISSPLPLENFSIPSSARSSLELPAEVPPYSANPSHESTSHVAESSAYQSQPIVSAANAQALEERAYLSELFSSQMYDNLFSDLFTSSFQKNPTVPGQHFHRDPTAALTDRLESATVGTFRPDVYYDAPAQLAIYDMQPLDTPFLIDSFGNLLPNVASQPSIPMSVAIGEPTSAELNEYLRLFISTYALHMPLVHIPTLMEGERLPVFVTAMQACGAMYANTPTAAKFIDSVLATKRDEIIAELSSDSKTYEQISQLTLASGLIQTIGLFHRDSDQRAKSNVYHGMIVMMLRMNGFVDKTRDWKLEEIDFSDPADTERAWRTWVKHESAKRAVWICYLHDCCHAIYFNLSPTFRTEQFTLGLPSEDALWTAKNATEWALVLQKPSPYGSTEVRLCGHYLRALYYYLSQQNPQNTPRPFNVSPFAHLVMIHAMMRKLFEMYLRDRLPFSQPDSTGLRPKINPHFVDRDRAFHVQILLHYWLQSWLNSPDTPRDVPETHQRFCFNALPFYWMAQVGLVAYQEGLPPFDPEGAYITSHDAKFYLMKKWERHIRKFLASGEQTPTKFWDEVMKIRIESWQAETGFEYDHLLGFFGQPVS